MCRICKAAKTTKIVSQEMLTKAMQNYYGGVEYWDFYNKVGVTLKQIQRYFKQHGKLRVYELTYKKIQIMAEGSPHIETLLRIADARK